MSPRVIIIRGESMVGKGMGLVFLAFALLALFAGIVFADISVTGYSVLPAELKPGSNGVITINIANAGTTTVSGIELTATATGPIDSKGSYFVGDLSPGGSTVITVPFKIREDAVPGVYSFQSSLIGFGESVLTSGQIERKFTQRIFTAPVTITNPADFQIKSTTESVSTDDDFAATGILAVSEGAAKSVKLYVNSSSFIQIGEVPVLLGDLDSGKSKPFVLNMTLAEGVSSGKYSIPILINYRDDVGNEKSATGYMTVNVNRRVPDFVISVNAAEGNDAVPGSRVKLRVGIKNTGNMDAYSVRVSLQNTTALTMTGYSESVIAVLPAGAEQSFYLDAGVNNIAPGFYPIAFSVRYNNRNGEEQAPKKVQAGIDVNAKNDMSFFVSARPTPIVAGDPATLSVLVSNVGSSSVKALWVKADSSTFNILDAEKKQFIGGLNADDFSTVQFKVLVADVPDGTYPIEVTASFKDAFNQEHSYTQNVTLAVVSRATAAKAAGTNGGLPIVPIAIVLVIAIAGFFAYRKFFGKHEEKGKAR